MVSTSDFVLRGPRFKSCCRRSSAHDCMAHSILILPLSHYDLNNVEKYIKHQTIIMLIGVAGLVNVSCISCHWGIQLILAYSWARPAILVAAKDREGMFLCLLFLHFHSCSSLLPVPLFHLLYYLFYLFSLSLTQNDLQGLTCR